MKSKVILVYTELGMYGSYLIQAPISLLYVATQIVNFPELEIEILDCRVQENWKEHLQKKIQEENILLVGFFVMSGLQVGKAFEVTEFVKNLDSKIPVIWGGPHPTILPEDVLKYGKIDFCVRGFGTDALTDLVKKLLNNDHDFESIPNLCFEKNGKKIIGEINSTYERISYKDLPYQLLDPLVEKYFEHTENRSFPIYTAFGCPYECNFCITPIWFSDTNKKWDPLSAEEVVSHIEFLRDRYNVDFIYFWDDDTFVSPRHFSQIAEKLIKRNCQVKIGVRGIRANEIEKMKEKDFELMQKVGVEFLHIGVENGSQRMLDLMDKGITVEESLSANRKLSHINNVTPMYNMLIGIPTESLEDLKETGKFMLRMAEDNPRSIIHSPNKLIPYPGGKAYEIAVEHGYSAPKTPQDWTNMDQEGEVFQPWYTAETNRYIHMLQISSYALSNWEAYLKNHALWLRMLYRVGKTLYKPIAKFRLKHQMSGFLLEYPIMQFAKRILEKLAP